MAKKMSVAKTKEKMTQVFNQAKESLKLFETFEKETLAKAKTFVKIPISGNPKTITNDKILTSLKKIGVCTQSELESLRLRIEKLEGEIASMKSEERVGQKLPLS
jgi:polyhydroxyalkanoate synthesis regulator phasin